MPPPPPRSPTNTSGKSFAFGKGAEAPRPRLLRFSDKLSKDSDLTPPAVIIEQHAKPQSTNSSLLFKPEATKAAEAGGLASESPSGVAGLVCS